jgi:hypothetical protein
VVQACAHFRGSLVGVSRSDGASGSVERSAWCASEQLSNGKLRVQCPRHKPHLESSSKVASRAADQHRRPVKRGIGSVAPSSASAHPSPRPPQPAPRHSKKVIGPRAACITRAWPLLRTHPRSCPRPCPCEPRPRQGKREASASVSPRSRWCPRSPLPSPCPRAPRRVRSPSEASAGPAAPTAWAVCPTTASAPCTTVCRIRTAPPAPRGARTATGAITAASPASLRPASAAPRVRPARPSAAACRKVSPARPTITACRTSPAPRARTAPRAIRSTSSATSARSSAWPARQTKKTPVSPPKHAAPRGLAWGCAQARAPPTRTARPARRRARRPRSARTRSARPP